MRIACIGGGPGGLYFALLAKRARPDWDIVLIDREQPHALPELGIVLSDASRATLASVDAALTTRLAPHLVHWSDIEVHTPTGPVVRSTGHGFAGVSRTALIRALQDEAERAGVELSLGRDVRHLQDVTANLVVGSDGHASTIRDALGGSVAIDVDVRPDRFIWLCTTRRLESFTFAFVQTACGLWRIHAYPHASQASTLIAECGESCWRESGLDRATAEESARFLQPLMARLLDGHPLQPDPVGWRQFQAITVRPWRAGRVVLLGDAAHTAHYSVGSGTRLAMDDAVALRDALIGHDNLEAALDHYEHVRRPAVESLQRAGRASMEWFEHVERYRDVHPTLFTFSLVTRSLRLTHEDLRARDPELLARVDHVVSVTAATQVSAPNPMLGRRDTPPPMFTPFRLRELVLCNRVVVSPMCQYSAEDGTVSDWHLVHLGSRAIGGAGLVMTEMTDVSREGRISLGCAGLYKPTHASAWRRIVDFVHRETPAKIGVQLGHAGRKGASPLPWEDPNQLPADDEWVLRAPSALAYVPGQTPTPKAMTRLDMDLVASEFRRATSLAEEAGFDLLELHMAHGYLLASFISPLTNQRQDDYGGTLANRMRFPLEIFDACREMWPAHKPMSVRVSAADWTPGGLSVGESVEVATLLKAHGCDIIDVSTGQTVADQQPQYGRLYQVPFSDRIRFEADIPTMAVGSISSYADVNTIIASGRADLCLLARAHLVDPYWTRHAAMMLGYDLPWPAPYRTVSTFQPRAGFAF